jgi:hypothetical protein
VSAVVSARALRRSTTILQRSCWSLRRSVAARLLPQRTEPNLRDRSLPPPHHPQLLDLKARCPAIILHKPQRWSSPCYSAGQRLPQSPPLLETPTLPFKSRAAVARVARRLLGRHHQACGDSTQPGAWARLCRLKRPIYVGRRWGSRRGRVWASRPRPWAGDDELAICDRRMIRLLTIHMAVRLQ